jgi:hypothetical protein
MVCREGLLLVRFQLAIFAMQDVVNVEERELQLSMTRGRPWMPSSSSSLSTPPPGSFSSDTNTDGISEWWVRSPSIYSKPWSARNESGPSGGSSWWGGSRPRVMH